MPSPITDLFDSLKKRWDSSEDDFGSGVIAPCLKLADFYRAQTGFLSSTVLSAWAPAAISLVQREVKIEILSSPNIKDYMVDVLEDTLTDQDKHTMLQRMGENYLLAALGLEKDPNNRKFIEQVFTYLIAAKKLEIKFAQMKVPDFEDALFHYKRGYFEFPDKSVIAYEGSGNLTKAGLGTQGNSFVVYKSDINEHEEDIAYNKRIIDLQWNGKQDSVIVTPITKESLTRIKEMHENEKAGFRKKLKKRLEPHKEKKVHLVKKPEFTEQDLRPYQLKVIEDWERASNTGLVRHATGSGKTFTALFALKRHFKKHSCALILVPSLPLHRQWLREIKKIIPDATIMSVSSKNQVWRKDGQLRRFTKESENEKNRKNILVAVNNSARTEKFLSNLSNNNHLFVIADEVHNLGSRENSKIFGIQTDVKMGLSATPERYFDPEGTERIFNYFGDILPTTYDLQDAIKDGNLVPYQYFPSTIYLSEKEQKEWDQLTVQINSAVGKCEKTPDGKRIPSEKLTVLCSLRARISKEAEHKFAAAIEILVNHFEENQAWLVYCQSKNQMEHLRELLNKHKLRPFMYYYEMTTEERDAALMRFETNGGILLSMKCLDEGVDIPSASHAFIIASDQNPRQFIQRRGRVLRKDDKSNKKRAIIHDLIVATSENYSDSLKDLTIAELKRANEFAQNSENQLSTEAKIEDIAIHSGIPLSKIELSKKADDFDNINYIEDDEENF